MGASIFSPPGAAGVNHIPLTGSEADAILAVNCNGDLTDLAGDAVFDDTPVVYPTNYEVGGSYDGLRDVLKTGNGIGTTTAADHRIPTATAITFGGFFFVEYVQTANPFPLFSGRGSIASERNYGFKIDPGNGGPFNPIPGGPDFGAELAIYETWSHLMITKPAGRGTATLYVNGAARSTVTSGDAGTMNALDTFWISSAISAPNTGLNGRCESIFVAAAEYTAAQVRTLAENAFGHALP